MSVHHRLQTMGILAGLVVASSATAWAAEGAGAAIQPGVSTHEEDVEQNRIPDLPYIELTAPLSAPVTPRELPAGPNDKGDIVTDGGLGLEQAVPNAIEQAKLDAARAAVEAARQSGALYQLALEEPPPVFAPEDIEAIKLQRLHTLEPEVLPQDAAAGVGDFPPIQATGPLVLSPEELEKLENNGDSGAAERGEGN